MGETQKMFTMKVMKDLKKERQNEKIFTTKGTMKSPLQVWFAVLPRKHLMGAAGSRIPLLFHRAKRQFLSSDRLASKLISAACICMV